MNDLLQKETVIIEKFRDGNFTTAPDEVAVEEPLEIVIAYSTANGYMQKNVAVTMRTPGAEAELALGFLYTEGIIPGPSVVLHSNPIAGDANRILVTLQEGIVPVLHRADRNFYSTSSCGVCGKASMEAIHVPIPLSNLPGPTIDTGVLVSLPGILRQHQMTFSQTGGLHACALFSAGGQLVSLQEDVGRHNALDKLIGGLLADTVTLQTGVLLLSGRASFELLQKAAMAGIKIVAAIGAPSSLAIELAAAYDITLIGFLREYSCNIYTVTQRVVNVNNNKPKASL